MNESVLVSTLAVCACVLTHLCVLHRYSFDHENHQEFCIVEYPESPAAAATAHAAATTEKHTLRDTDKAEDLSQSIKPRPPVSTKPSEQDPKHKDGTADSSKKKKPFHCKPCHFQAQNETEFVEHLRTHSVSKMLVVNRVEARSRTRAKEAEPAEPTEVEGGGDGAGTPGDVKGLIRCERCGYNTNRYDHYIAHLKHHSKEGEDHR